MFSDQYIKLCTQPEVAEKLREEWKKRGPKPGDWVVLKAKHAHKDPLLVIGTNWERDVVYVQGTPGRGRGIYNVIPLFQPRQIIEMLEEKEQFFELRGPMFQEDARYAVDLMDDELPTVYGPDPETALLKAYLEVVKDG